MKKIIELDDNFPSGESTVQLVLPLRGGKYDLGRITKTASEAADYLKNVAPEPGKSHLLILALGGEEKWGPNRNGDGFSEFPVRSRGDAAKRGEKWLVEPGQELTKHYQSFETNPAHAFKHHANKDPEKASGVVKKAFWNPRMSRVELLTLIDNEKDAEWIQRVEAGEKVATSMGCKISFDVCNMCGNKAPTRMDYCFVPATKITMADGSRKTIDKIDVGDKVLSATGYPTRVTHVMKRDVDECMVQLRSSMSGEFLLATQNHPIFSSPRELYSCYYRVTQPETRSCFPGTLEHCTSCKRTEPAPRETPAGELRIDDSLYAPAVLGAGTSRLSKERAYVVGLFMAEGCYGKVDEEHKSLQFSLHKDEIALISAVQKLATDYGREARIYSRDGNDGVSVRINNPEAAQDMFKLCGEYAHTKKASQEIVDLPDDVLLEYIRGLWDGDGHISEIRDNYSRLNTASEDLAWQTAGLLRRLGYASYVGTALVPGGPTNRTNKFTQWYVATDYGTNQRRKYTAFVEGRQLGFVKETSHVAYTGPVHNFETEDHTYVAAGIAVHNCEHAKYKLGELNDDGTKNFVYNPSPSFFDISRVFRPADKTSYTLKKVADFIEIRSSAELGNSAESAALKSAAARKLSDITKIIQGEPAATSTLSPDEQSLIVKFRDHAGDKLAASPAIPRSAMRGRSLRQVLAAADKAGVILKDAEFIETFIEGVTGSRARLPQALIEKTAEAAQCAIQLFEESPALLDWIVEECKLGESLEYADAELDAAMKTASEKRGYMGEMLYRRLVPEGAGIRPDAQANTDILHTAQGETTRGAALAAQDAVTTAHAKKLLGGAALTLGGYKMLSAFPGMKSPLARGVGALGMGALGAQAFGSRPGGTMPTAEGVQIPDITEIAPKTAAIVHLVECARNGRPTRDLSSAKIGSRVDSVAGLVLDPDAAVDCLGAIALGS